MLGGLADSKEGADAIRAASISMIPLARLASGFRLGLVKPVRLREKSAFDLEG
jgi:hypothetical protein